MSVAKWQQKGDPLFTTQIGSQSQLPLKAFLIKELTLPNLHIGSWLLLQQLLEGAVMVGLRRVSLWQIGMERKTE